MEGEELASNHRRHNVAGEVAHLKRFELFLESWQQVLKDREGAVSRREREAEEAQLRLEQRALKIQEETLRTPLLRQPERKKNDDTYNWRLGVSSVIVVASVFVVLRQIRPLLPHDYFSGVVDTLAVLWAPCSVVLANRVSGRYRTGKKFSFHVTRLICLCFSLLVIYALYVISWPRNGNFPGLSPSSIPTPAATTTVGSTSEYRDG